MGQVAGVIRYRNGRPAAGVHVIAGIAGLRKDRRLGEATTTDANGRYRVAYDLPKGPPSEGHNLRVRVVDADSNTLATSEVRFNSSADETIDLDVDLPQPPATFAHLAEDLETATVESGVPIHELDDMADGADVTFLAGRTGDPPDAVARLIRAARIAADLAPSTPRRRRPQRSAAPAHDAVGQELADEDRVRVGVVYALLATDPGADLSTLAAREPERVRADVAAAVAAGIIPESYAVGVPAVLDALELRRVSDYLEPPIDGSPPSPIAIALDTIHAPSVARTAVAELALAYGANETGLWAAVATDPRVPGATREHLSAAVEFLRISGGNAELLDSVTADPELGEVDAINPAALVKLGRKDWAGRFVTAGPVDGQPADPAGDVDRYAATLTDAIERRYSSEKLLFELSRDKTKRNPLVEHFDDIATFIGNNPDFHLLDTPIVSLLADEVTRAARLKGMTQPDETVELVAAYQRLERLLPDLATEATWDAPTELTPHAESHYGAISRLVRDGFRSAIDVGAVPLREFDARYRGTFGDRQLIAMVHNRAEVATDLSLHTALAIRDWADPIVPRALPRAMTWADTFGAAESCECGHCLSITSPAAYLFDSLRFLEDAGGTQQPLSPLDVLKRRRSDLVEVVLTCDNTNTQLPYVDIVNELLETLVVPDWFKPFDLPAATAGALTNGQVSSAVRQAFVESSNGIALSRDAVAYPLRTATAAVKTWHLIDGSILYVIRRNGTAPRVEIAAFQTAGAQEELRAAPQHSIPSAYRRLEQQVHPWTMPFSLAWSEVTEYLARLEVGPGEILDAFAPASTPSSSLTNPFESQDANAGAFLGLSPVDFQIIAGQKTAGSGPITLGGPNDYPEDFWGLARGVVQTIRDWDGTTVLAPWDVAIFRVPWFLELSGLSYVELLELLGSYFLNPATATGPGGRQLFIASRDGSDPATCELAKLELQGIPTNGGVALAAKIHRFVRLRRRLGWSVADLDRVLVAIGSTAMDREALVAVSMVERLRRRTGLEIRELSGWLGTIDHDRYYDVSGDEPAPLPSFYDEVFRIPDALEPGSPFVEDAAALSDSIGSNHIRVAARLGITEPDLDLFRNDGRILASADRNSLNLTTLSALSRYASFARWASLDADELIAAVGTFGFEPFASDPSASSIDRANAPLRFVEALNSLADAGLRPTEAWYVFADAGALDASPALTPEAIAAALGAVVDAARPVLAALAYPADAGAEIVAAELGRLGWSETLAKEAADFFVNSQLYSTPLVPADAPTAALSSQSRVVYDEAAGTLTARGALTPTELQSLQALTGATAGFTVAVQALFDQPRAFARIRLGTVVAPEYSVPLMRLPANLKLPRPLEIALRYDADRRVLAFRGSRDLLSLVPFPSGTLNQEWTALKAAVDALAADPLPAIVVQDPPIAQNAFFAAPAELDTLLGGTRTPEQRCAFALARIAVARWRIEGDAAAASALGGVAGLDAAALRAAREVWTSLLTDPATNGPSSFVRNPTFSTAAASPVASVVRRLHKLGLLLERLGLPMSAGLWLLRNAGPIGASVLQQLPARSGDPAATWDSVQTLVDFARAYRGYQSADGSLLDLLDLVANPFATHADWATLAARIKGWDSAQVRDLTGSPSFPATFDRPQLYVRLLDKMRIASRCGVSGGTLAGWHLSLASSPGGVWTGMALESLAAEVKSGVRSKVGRERWLQIATEVNDPLRERRRDALVTYLLARPNPWDGERLRDADHLFDYLLIDTEMAACMPTSRIRAAMSSVQTFMQRALMNLEPEVAVLSDRAREWNTWRKQYRVWEANRKVFLYPENWLEPTLRDDKTELFVAVENGLLQAPMSAESATKAVAEYLDGLTGLSDLEIAGAYHQRELVEGELVDEMHIVGRSRAVPREYFYRRATGASTLRTASWGAWSKLDLDIDSDYVLPFATGTDAYVFWPVIAPVVPKTTDTSNGSLPSRMPKKLEIKLAWSRNGGRGWSSKLISRDGMVVDRDEREIKDAFAFGALASVEGAYVSASAIRTTILGAVDPALLSPKAVISAPLAAPIAIVSDDFYFVVTVSDSFGQPIRNATVVVTEISNMPPAYYVSGIVPMQYGPGPRSYTSTTDQNGRAVSRVLARSWAPRWNVSAMLPSSVSSEIVSPHHCARVVATPAARTDKIRQQVRVAFSFSRKPVTTQVTQALSFGVFAVERGGNVAVSQWDPTQFAPTTLQPSNVTWADNAFEEKPGADDRLFLPELPNRIVVPHTPGLFRLRPLNQPLLSMDPTYFVELGQKRYAIDLAPAASQKVPVLTPTFHPYAQDWTKALAAADESVILRLDPQSATDGGAVFTSRFMSGGVATLGPDSVPVEDVGFGAGAFYEAYNWELFFQLPLAVATQLMRNQRFADAQRWLHYIFDPTAAGASTFSPQLAWKFKPFYDAPPSTLAGLFADPAGLEAQLAVLRKDPFNPWAIARLRTVALMKNAVMTYLDNLIGWGDQLFARDSTESLNEATQIYLLAHQVLGPRPQRVPRRARPTPQTYRSMAELASGQALALSDIGAIAVEVSSFLPLSGAPTTTTGAPLGTMLYFCVGGNEKLLRYWDTIEDRLFKVRHCLDIAGRFRVPALFEPPIDPALLIRARAAGVDIADVLADASAPLPNYRFSILAQKATELASELKGLGASLLAALEKRDGEALALLRQRHELSLAPLVEEIRKKQIDDADTQLDALRRSRDSAMERLSFYQRVLGQQGGGRNPTRVEYLPAAVQIGGGGEGTTGLALSQHEITQLNLLEQANTFTLIASGANVLAGILMALPDAIFPVKWGGSHAGSAANAIGSFFNLLATNASYQANRQSIVGQFARRQDDWSLQHNLAVSDLQQIDRQIAGAEIRKVVAEQELTNHRKQTENSKELDVFLRTKYTNQQLYDWQVAQLAGLYFSSYRLAHAVAKRAERAFREELGILDSDFVKFGYWDEMRRGLLAGERLHNDVKRMEVAYLDENDREYEITKHVSLASLNPTALVELRRTGACEFVLPEWAFDLDYPGHYMRRIKNVSVTIPAVIGPYASVNCTLTMQSSSTRVMSTAAGAYPRKQQNGAPQDDARFVDRFSAAQSIVTSTGQNDPGLFETNLRDERYLPFEGRGAISRWQVELKAESNSIDPNSIRDLILHVRYTAREGGQPLANAARASVRAIIKPATGASLFTLFSLRQDFPDDWHRLLSGATSNVGPLDAGRRRFPLLFSRKKVSVLKERDYYLVEPDGTISPLPKPTTGGLEVELAVPPAADKVVIDEPKQRVDLALDSTKPDTLPVDLLVVCRYRVG
jgi:hypothetical protein